MADTEKPCECEVVDIQYCGPDDVDCTICYCPLHEAAPIGLKLAKAVLALSLGTEHHLTKLARRVVGTAEPKEE